MSALQRIAAALEALAVSADVTRPSTIFGEHVRRMAIMSFAELEMRVMHRNGHWVQTPFETIHLPDGRRITVRMEITSD